MKRQTLAELAKRMRRWLAAGRHRWILVAGVGTATIAWSGSVHAQPAHDPPVAHPSAEHSARVGAGEEEPAGEHAAGEHGGRAHATGEHGDDHAIHHPEPFNFADVERYKREKRMAAAEEKSADGQVPVPVTPYVYLLTNAALLFWIYYRFGKKPVMAGLESRRATVAKELDEAARIKAEAQARLDEYSRRLDELDRELGRIKAELVAAGEADRERMVREAEERATRMRKDAQFLLDQELKQLRIDLLRYTVDAATAAAEQVLRTRVTPQDQERVADEYLKQLVALAPAAALGTTTRPRSPGGEGAP